MRWLRNLLLRFLGLTDHEGRLKDLERHFVTKRDDKGQPTQTLADIPLAERKKIEPRKAGLSWQQRKSALEFEERKAR